MSADDNSCCNGSDGAFSSFLRSPHQFGFWKSWLVSVGCYNMYDTFTHNYFDLSANSKASKTLSWKKVCKNVNIPKIWVIRRRWGLCAWEVLCLKHLVILAPALTCPRWRWGMVLHQSSWLGDRIHEFCFALRRFILCPCTYHLTSFCPQSVKEGWCFTISQKCWTLNSLVLIKYSQVF